MDSRATGRLAGWEIHGFHTMEDLDVDAIMKEATTRWLRPNEIHAMLCNHSYFSIRVKPVNLPPSGTIVLFDRKVLRNFRKDGHNWKKKKDGKTVKEAHEHLKVGDEERIHIYYAHGLDNPSFVRRCYWLLDKKQEHIVLVHYRETLELQGSPATPVHSNSSSGTSDPNTSKNLSEEIDSGVDHAFYAEVGDSRTVRIHELCLHEINTLEWEDLLATEYPNNPPGPKRDEVSYLEQHNLYEMSNSNNGSLLPTDNLPAAGCVPVDVKLPTNEYFQTMGMSDCRQDSEEPREGKDKSLVVPVEGLQIQDSFGRWMNYIMTDSPGSIDDPPLESPIPSGHESSLCAKIDNTQPSTGVQVFSITEVSPAWAFSTEETKVIVIGCFSREFSHLAETRLLCVFGDIYVPAEMVQYGVFRCMALPHSPGPVNLYLSFDGCTPISQVLTFEYRPMNSQVAQPDVKWEGFEEQLRLAHLLFSTTNSLNLLCSKLSPKSLREAKRFADKISSVNKGWAQLFKSVGDGISFPQAKNSLLELSLKNKFLEWLLERVVEGCKTPGRDHQGQGVIHLCAILDYTWSVKPYSYSGLSLDFRDASGWTALHWAAYCGRKEMVAVLLSAGAKPDLVTDPTPEFPGGRTAADLASKNGYDGLAAYLAEKGLIAQMNAMYIAGNLSGSPQTSSTDVVNSINLSEDELCLKDSLAAYRTAADAAARIQSSFRESSLKLRAKAVKLSNPEDEARTLVAAMRIQHAFRNYEMRKRMAAAARIQYRFHTWKIRKEFLNMRRQAIRIQAAFRSFQQRKQYRKILWSVGVLEKAIIRWRQKRKGFRGLQVQGTEVAVVNQNQENDVEEDFFRISRKQAEERVERSVIRVQAMFRSKQAQLEYQKMKFVHNQAALEMEFEGLLDPEVG